MREAIQRFLGERSRYWSVNTTSRYAWYLAQFARWLEEEYPPARCPQFVTKRMLEQFLEAKRTWGPSTQYTAVIAFREFFRFTVGREESPAEKIPLPKRRMKAQRTLDEKKLGSLLASLDTSTPKGIRDTAIILLLLDSGLRSAEVCRLLLKHTDLDAGTFSVKIKGGSWAEGVYCDYTAEQLRRWLAVREGLVKAEVGTVFVGIGGKRPGHPMTPDGLRAIFRQLGQQVGFPFSPHDFRRTFATLAVRGGAPTRLVQVAGRWSSIEMVERYTQVLRPADFAAYSPVARLMGLRVKDDEA